MSAQTIADVFVPVEAKYKAEVMANTFGHLAPKKNRTYKGRVVYAVGCFGNDDLNPTTLVCDFKGLDSSPWFYNTLMEFIGKQKFEPGCAFEFKGTFRNYEFKGTITMINNFN
jgi:hypothetical protein